MSKLKPGIVQLVKVSDLERDPHQPRKAFEESELKALGASLAVRVLVPLSVRHDGSRLVIVDGERRWRAAKLQKLDTLPCLLAEVRDTIEVGAMQITTSQQREQLAPLEIAEYLVALQKRAKKSPNELLAELAKLGIHEIGRAKLEQFLELVKLPAWAKELLNDGRLTEHQATLLLPAIPFPKVFGDLKDSLLDQISWNGGLTNKEVTEAVATEFRRYGHDLNKDHGPEEMIRQFPIEQCRGCACYKKIGALELCMDVERFKKRNAETLKLIALKQSAKTAAAAKGKPAKPVKISRDNPDPTLVPPREFKVGAGRVIDVGKLVYDTYNHLVDVPFDVATICKGCPHKQLAAHGGKKDGAEEHCFHPPCYNKNSRAAGRLEGRRERMQAYLEKLLRPAVIRYMHKRLDPAAKHAIYFWLATGAPESSYGFHSNQDHERAAEKTAKVLEKHKLQSLQAIVEKVSVNTAVPYWEDLLAMSGAVFKREQLRWVALRIQVDLAKDLAYQIDEEYLAMKRRAELIDLAKLAGVENGEALSVVDLKKALLAARAAIGVPEDLQKLYLEKFEDKRTAADLEDELDDQDEPDLDAVETLALATSGIQKSIESSADKRKKGAKARQGGMSTIGALAAILGLMVVGLALLDRYNDHVRSEPLTPVPLTAQQIEHRKAKREVLEWKPPAAADAVDQCVGLIEKAGQSRAGAQAYADCINRASPGGYPIVVMNACDIPEKVRQEMQMKVNCP